MNAMIYNPLSEYESTFRERHRAHTDAFFEDLVRQSGVNAEENRTTVAEYRKVRDSVVELRKKLNLWRFLRVLMILTLILIPLVILKITPKIRGLRARIEEAEAKAEELLTLAYRQMEPLNRLFTDRDAIRIMESTIPLLSFAPYFSAEQEQNMAVNYDYCEQEDREQSTIDVLAGSYHENPFVFEKNLIHTMGTEVYHGYKTIHWTESYRGSDGKRHTRHRTQTLHATLTKPKPFYHTQVKLHYCAQGGPDLSFTRDASHLDRKSEKELERHVKRGEKRLKKKTDEAIRENRDFISMSNTDFEVLFDALDRTDEVQFRTLFTPLAQTNMVDLIVSQSGYGDDFDFIKKKRTNTVITKHSQGRDVTLDPKGYTSYSFDEIREKFSTKNIDFFKAVYFDFAPLWAIPMYQDRPVHSLDPLPDYKATYSDEECEVLANMAGREHVAHPATRTRVIVKSSFVKNENKADEVRIAAYSYDIDKRVDFVPVHGGDGRWHNVPVPWDDYRPLEATNTFFVAQEEAAKGRTVLARRSNLCLFT